MRCQACDKALTDLESNRKYLWINEYIGLCTRCTDDAGIDRADKASQDAALPSGDNDSLDERGRETLGEDADLTVEES